MAFPKLWVILGVPIIGVIVFGVYVGAPCMDTIMRVSGLAAQLRTPLLLAQAYDSSCGEGIVGSEPFGSIKSLPPNSQPHHSGDGLPANTVKFEALNILLAL